MIDKRYRLSLSENSVNGIKRHAVKQRTLLDMLSAKCASCGTKKDLEIDHKIPVSEGGSESSDNLQVLCHACHKNKHLTRVEKHHERRLRLNERDRKILLDALHFYFKSKMCGRDLPDEAEDAYKLAYAIYMPRTGRRARYGYYSSEPRQKLKNLREWAEEVTYKPKPLTEEEQAEMNSLIARLRR